MFIAKFAAAALVALTVLPVTADAQIRIGTMEKFTVDLASNIDLSWTPEKRLITLKVSTGCQSSSLRPAGDQTDIRFDRTARKISIKGGFTRLVGPGDHGRPKHADCHGTKTRTEIFENVGYGDLEVIHRNKPLWTVHLGPDAVERHANHLKTGSAFAIGKGKVNRIFKNLKGHAKSVRGKTAARQAAITAGPATARESDFYDGFREIRVAPGLATSGQFIDVLMPFLQGHPDSLEGRQAMELKIWRYGAGYRVDLVRTGYPDDSVSGEHYRGSVIRTSKGDWELLTLAVKTLCARGETAKGACL
ncbi:hypothetical protein [Roseibium aggregatum]|uniref:Uncharacterized protein n=1 Tax=Roseibium aggregatum TaxID=187304 RepID=A0A926S4S7_9HYPH|nr:hypothetical protein [Roseibium aggregatum]MBD1545410.1 hypothetical protein [Roseibium aggregatum]